MIRALTHSRGPAGLPLALGLAVALCCRPAWAQQAEAALMKRAGDLRELPAETARSLAALPAQEAVTRLGDRQGLWVQVQTRAGVTGWVRLFDVGPSAAGTTASSARPAAATASGTGSAVTDSLRGLTGFLRGGPQPAPTTATTTLGIRGLEAQDLARAQPDMDAVRQMEQLRQGERGARDFALQAALAAVPVPALPQPARGPVSAAGRGEERP